MNPQETGTPTSQPSMSTLLSLLPSPIQPGSFLQIQDRMSEHSRREGSHGEGREEAPHPRGALIIEQPWAIGWLYLIPAPKHSHPSCQGRPWRVTTKMAEFSSGGGRARRLRVTKSPARRPLELGHLGCQSRCLWPHGCSRQLVPTQAHAVWVMMSLPPSPPSLSQQTRQRVRAVVPGGSAGALGCCQH